MININPFYEEVYKVVGKIPFGKVVSYGQISRYLGRIRSAREVGRAMRYCNLDIPCHRVVMADGSVTGGVHSTLRRELLESEGITFLEDGRVDMKQHQLDLNSIEINL